MKKYKIFIALIIIIVLILLFFKFHKSEIKKEDADVMEYIKCSDDASKNIGQVNWKEVMAVIAYLNDNKIKDIGYKKIVKIANLFINTQKNKINTLNDVMDNLKINKHGKKVINNYLSELDSYGIVPERLNKSGKYMKFINSIKEDATQTYRDYKVLPSITIAQAILESNWGDSKLAKEYNSLFGIKADINWKGKSVSLETIENSGTKLKSKFRVYDDRGQSIRDHANFLYMNKRYKINNVFNSNTYIYQANALQNAGYSTSVDMTGKKDYAKKITDLIRQYNLQLIDNEVEK